MKSTLDMQFDSADDVAVEELLAQARLVAEHLEQVLNRPLAADTETLCATADAELVNCLRSAQELVGSSR